MKDLKCGLTQCMHNSGYSCCANCIDVDSFTDCLTFEEGANRSRGLFESSAEFESSNYTVDTEVTCHAKCIFNRDNRCMSNGITVMSEDRNDATCLTFVHS